MTTPHVARRTKLRLLLLPTVLLAAACGGDDDGGAAQGSAAVTGGTEATAPVTEVQSTESEPTATPSTDTAPAGDPIVVGHIGSCTGVSAASTGGGCTGIGVWAEWVNASGGINGFPVEVVQKDDGGDPGRSLAAVKELVEEDGVVAIVGHSSNFDTEWQNYVAEKGVPVIGGVTTSVPMASDLNFYPVGTQFMQMTLGMFQQAKDAGFESIGVTYCAEAPSCAQIVGAVEAISAITGQELVYSGKVAASAVNYTAECLAAADAGADVIWSATTADVAIRMSADCSAQGLDFGNVSGNGSLNLEWLSLGDAANVIGAQETAPFWLNRDLPDELATPATQEYHDAFQQYGQDVINAPNNNSMVISAWASGKMFERVATNANLTPASTAADVVQGLYTIENETLGGLIPPTTYVEGQKAAPNCYFVSNIVEGQFEAPNGLEPSCIGASDLEKLFASLGG
jgi:branched-chain amino acid transport system substrate-binding protein